MLNKLVCLLLAAILIQAYCLYERLGACKSNGTNAWETIKKNAY